MSDNKIGTTNDLSLEELRDFEIEIYEAEHQPTWLLNEEEEDENMSFEEYCKVRQINVNELSEEEYENLWLDYAFDVEYA